MKTVNRIIKLKFCFLFLIIIFTACSGNSTENVGETPAKAPTETQADIVSSPKSYTVEIKQMAFTPAEITVNKGDTITFINNDILAHNVTEQSSKLWASPELAPKQSWKMEAKASADYYCTIHPTMKGKIIVK